MNLADLFTSDNMNVAGGIASVLSVIVAVVQTVRYRQAARLLRHVERSRNAATWQNIVMVLRVYDSLHEVTEMDRQVIQTSPDRLMAKINRARECVVNQWIQLIKEAALEEPIFNEEVIERWQRQGRLENDWRVAHARKLLDIETVQTKAPRGPARLLSLMTL